MIIVRFIYQEYILYICFHVFFNKRFKSAADSFSVYGPLTQGLVAPPEKKTIVCL